MRILWANTYSQIIGGCEQYIKRCVKMLKHHGVSSALLHEDESADLAQVFDASYTSTDEAVRDFNPDIIFVHKLSDASLKKLISTSLPIVKFFHDYETFCLKGIKLRPFTNQPCREKASCKCYPFFSQIVRTPSGFTLRTLWHLRRSQQLHRQLDGFCTPSDYVKREAEIVGFDGSKIRTFYPLIPQKPPSTQHKEEGLILYVGQLLRGKGVDVAIDAMKYLPQHYRLVIIGTGRKQASYVKQSKKDKRIQFTGFLKEEELAKWHEKAACQVVPSRHPEPFGMVGLEAMRYGIPVVGSNLGGIPEWLHDKKNGLLVPHNDPKALASAIQTICSDPSLSEQMGIEGKKTYEALAEPDKHAEQLLNFFREIISRKQKLTVKGSEQVEKTLQELLEEVKIAVRKELPESKVKALLLTGGYGRGEGGVIFIDKKEKPHNNLDFVLITNGPVNGLKKAFRSLLNPISQKYDIGFDISVVSNIKLRLSPTHLIWYEVFHGHKLLIGDPNYIRSLPFSDPRTILERDILELMINRGTLFIINDFLLRSNPTLNEEQKRIFIKHMMKGIIGYGDALLYTLGEYHWSYREKLKRIQNHPDIPEKLKHSYKEAAEFRFSPDYEHYFNRDFRQWLDQELETASTIYLNFERFRLKNPYLKWDHYTEQFLQSSLTERVSSLTGLARKLKGLLNRPESSLGTSKQAQIGFYALSPAERLGVYFPYVAFHKNREEIGALLGVRSDSQEEFDRAYLHYWSQHGDLNFKRSVEEWELKLH